jgi:hypothetical protein
MNGLYTHHGWSLLGKFQILAALDAKGNADWDPALALAVVPTS